LEQNRIPFPIQSFFEATSVGGVACFHHTMHRDRVDILRRKGAVVFNITDAAAFLCNQGGKARQPTGTITDVGAEATETSVRGQAALQNPSENGRVDIAA